MKRVLLLFAVLITNTICYAQYVPNPTMLNPTGVYNSNTRPKGTPPSNNQILELKQYINGIRQEAYQQNQRINEESLKLRKPSKEDYWKSPEFAQQTKAYSDAFDKLKDMLTGKTPLSVKDAYYEIENANGNTYLSKEEYDLQIKKSSNFIRQWLVENKYSLKNNISLHFGIQKFMSDTLTIGKKHNKEMPGIKPETHLGFYYDYQDYKAQKDERSYYVTKTFATGNGQCHTLPIVYLILAEQLGAKTYLSYAPIHSFIKYPDNKGNIHNYEVTTNWQISDQWYKENFNIKSLAIKKVIYLNTMNSQQIVACAMLDLASSYDKKFGITDGSFIAQCVDYAINYFPNKEANITAWLLRVKVANIKLNRIAKNNPDKTKEEIENIPEAKALINDLNLLETKIESLGYEPIPEAIYDKMLQNQENKANLQDLKQLDNLKKRDLFIIQNQ